MVRIGPHAFVYDDPYEFSVGFKINGRIATLTGTHAPVDGITLAHKRAACETLERAGYEVQWTHKGKKTMSKPLHEKHGAKDSSGAFKTDHATVGPIVAAYIAKLASGEHKILGISEIDLGNGLYARTFVIQE